MQKAHIIAPPSSTLVGAVSNNPDPKSLKPPSLLPFSGTEPVPKDKVSCEQWVWQAREALKTCTLGAVRTAVIQSVRGEVREFVSSVGFETSDKCQRTTRQNTREIWGALDCRLSKTIVLSTDSRED